MPVKVTKQGDYELFETTRHHKILVLDGKQWYAAVKGQQGDILVHSDSDHKRDRTLQKGQFYLAEFQNDPKFKDMPHLFLEKDGNFQELMVPNGLPTNSDTQKKVVWTDDTMKKDELARYLKQPAGEGEERMDRPGGNLPIRNYDELTVDEVNDHLDDLSAKQLEQIRRYENEHKGRKTVLEAVARKLH
jgi:hypothetical protein